MFRIAALSVIDQVVKPPRQRVGIPMIRKRATRSIAPR